MVFGLVSTNIHTTTYTIEYNDSLYQTNKLLIEISGCALFKKFHSSFTQNLYATADVMQIAVFFLSKKFWQKLYDEFGFNPIKTSGGGGWVKADPSFVS